MNLKVGMWYATRRGDLAYTDHVNPYDGQMEGLIYMQEGGMKHGTQDMNGYHLNTEQDLVKMARFE